MSRIRGATTIVAPTGLALALLLTAAGCEAPAPPVSSPTVAPDSPEAQKARAEDEALRKERQEQEAKARRRVKGAGGLPDEG